MADTRLIDDLRAVVGPAHVLVDAADVAAHTTDWTGRWQGWTPAVVRPSSTDEVVGVLRACADHGAAVVPQGGNTGLVGGSVPRDGEVVLSLRRLDHVGPVEASTPSITAGAGATLADVQAAAAAAGLAVGVDLAARGSATVGGMVATNAGGIHVVAHGTMRQQLLGLEAVLADGAVVQRLPGLVKDGAGYDLPQLLCGSEGTLAVITAVHLRLVPQPTATTTLLIGCADVGDVLDRLAAARQVAPLRAAELMRERGVRLVADAGLAALPLAGEPTPAVLLLELDGVPGDEALADLVGDRPAEVAVDAADARRLWAVREEHTEAVGRLGVPLKLDVTVPLDRMVDVVAALDALVPDAITFGHIAEGTLHISVPDAAAGVDAAVLRLVADHGGSIASEHGVGVAKAALLHLTRGPAEIAAMRAVKQALDPTWSLNPGAVLAPPQPAGRGS